MVDVYTNCLLYVLIVDHLIESTDNKNVKALSEILGFDPYMHVCSVSLQVIFDEERQEDTVTKEFFFNFAYDNSEYAEVFQILLNRYFVT